MIKKAGPGRKKKSDAIYYSKSSLYTKGSHDTVNLPSSTSGLKIAGTSADMSSGGNALREQTV